MTERTEDCLALAALYGGLSVCGRVDQVMCLLFCSPGTVSGLLTGLPSGGLSPTMLGSWALGGAEYTDGSVSCS